MKKSAVIFWFTGLSGSGKSTIVERTAPILEKAGYRVWTLDGDWVRKHLHSHLGFSAEQVRANNAAIAELCRKHRHEYDAILVPIISPLLQSRAAARRLLGDGFFEIYCRADLACVVSRDAKGLYARAQRGEIPDMIGFSRDGVPYEPPEDPDCALDTAGQSAEQACEVFYAFAVSKLKGTPE